MRAALGFKARTGRAVLVAIAGDLDNPELVERSLISLLPDRVMAPYHAAEGLSPEQARKSVKESIAIARKLANNAMRDAIRRVADAGHEVRDCGILVGSGMPNWTVDEILAVHFRMHKAEGELFRDVLVEGAKAYKLELTTLPDKSPFDAAASVLGLARTRLDGLIAALGKQAGPPWTQHQKEAAAAALAALKQALSKRRS